MAHVSIVIEREEYDSFVKAIPSDNRLPGSYYDWIKYRLQEDSDRIAQGQLINKVIIHYDDFTRYCRTAGLEPSYVALQACAVAIFAGINL
ncbi:MAG: hypothetical protein WA373_01945 [Burkholderiales bacterium]